MVQTNKLISQVPMPPLEGPGPSIPDNPIEGLDNIISTLIGFLSIVAILWFTIQTIFAGYKYLSSHGDKSKIEEASRSITNNLLGLAIAVFAIFLVAFIGKILGLGNVMDLPTLFNSLPNNP